MPTERFYRISEQKRRKIGEAIIQEIQQRGYRSIQLGKIASKANISRASLYTYFENKDDILSFSIQHLQETMWRDNEKVLAENGGDLWDMLEKSLEHLNGMPIEENKLPHGILYAMPTVKEYREYKSWIYQHVSRRYKNCFSEEEFGIFLEICYDCLLIAFQEFLTGMRSKEQIEKTFHLKMVQIKSYIDRLAVNGEED